jgi:hypothetical protein
MTVIASASSRLPSAKRALLLAAGVCALAVPAAAQQPASAQASPTTPLSSVTVQPAAPEAVKKLSRNFVQSLALRSGKIDQLPRWHGPICIAVRGLPADQAALVSTRVEDVAKAVGLKVQKPGCQSNIQILFTDQPQKMADTIGEAYLGYHNPSDSQKMRTVSHPIQGWYATSTTGAAGATGLAFAGGTGTSGTPSMSHGPDSPDTSTSAWESNFGQVNGVQLTMDVVDSPQHAAPTGCADSRFSSCMKSMFANVILVADTYLLDGKDLGMLADYLALLAVSEPKSLDGCNAMPSVLDVLAKSACQGRDAPNGLTPADAAYLTSLYESDPENRTVAAENDITGRMANILIKARAVSH